MKTTFGYRNHLLLLFCLLNYCASVCLAENITSTTAATTTTTNNTLENEDALILTNYIKSGNLTEGRRLSAVHLPDVDFNLTSYSGYFTVNETTNSSLFFWFFPAQTGKVENVPLLLWLQGGPANSFGIGLFVENGPLKVIKNEDGQTVRVVLRNETWNREFALLYLDSPAGTGFSYTQNDSIGYATSHQEASRDLLEALKQFFTIFSEYRGNPFYLTGQSYSGKFVPSLASTIHRFGKKEETVEKWGINLQGFAIGNGFCDPASQLNYGDFLFATGLIDRKQRDLYRERDVQLRKIITEKDHNALIVDLNDEAGLFVNRTGLQWLYNFLEDDYPKGVNDWKEFVGRNSTRTALHVGNNLLNDYGVARGKMREDLMVSVKAEVEELLEAGYRALFYAGNLDIIVAAPLVENFVHNLNWTGGGGQKFYESERIIYRVNSTDPKVAGYVKQVSNLLYIVVRNAGHLVPYDQPRVALNMITRFVKGRSFKNE